MVHFSLDSTSCWRVKHLARTEDAARKRKVHSRCCRESHDPLEPLKRRLDRPSIRRDHLLHPTSSNAREWLLRCPWPFPSGVIPRRRRWRIDLHVCSGVTQDRTKQSQQADSGFGEGLRQVKMNGACLDSDSLSTEAATASASLLASSSALRCRASTSWKPSWTRRVVSENHSVGSDSMDVSRMAGSWWSRESTEAKRVSRMARYGGAGWVEPKRGMRASEEARGSDCMKKEKGTYMIQRCERRGGRTG